MPASAINDLTRLCIHTITTRPWDIDTAVEHYGRAGVAGITLWREWLGAHGPGDTARLVRDAGLEPVSLARGGFFPQYTDRDRGLAIDENRRAIDECAELGAPVLVLVCGAMPGLSRLENLSQIRRGLEAVLPHAEGAGVKLGVEPLHPMYADTRSAVVKMKTANEICEEFGSPALGVTVDVYHVWWDPDLEAEIARAAAGSRLFSFHICDWKTPVEDMLNDRGLMGEGIVDIRAIRGMMEDNGFAGFNEVEIFSGRWWASDQEEFLRQIVHSYLEHS